MVWYGTLSGMAKIEDEAVDRSFYFRDCPGGGRWKTDPFLGDEKRCTATCGGGDGQALVSLTRTAYVNVWYLVWCDMVWWCGVWYCTEWRDMVWYGMVWR